MPSHPIAELRKACGWSQGELAAEAHVSRSAVARAEAGVVMPKLETLWALAEALGVPLGRLLHPGRGRRDGEGAEACAVEDDAALEAEV